LLGPIGWAAMPGWRPLSSKQHKTKPLVNPHQQRSVESYQWLEAPHFLGCNPN
jgi:hypothetical protein